ncbi:MAG: single-stranded-DNA-specific exonuclease RecJ [Fimbriimonadaceae bacterium]|nr:single-stranded-DNA-specific exonuclease RecJ [Fimbriimonadaceae bacterium]
MSKSSSSSSVATEWRWPTHDREAELRLESQVGLSPLMVRVLVQKGFTDPDKVHRYLNPHVGDLHDPSLLPDYAAAESILLEALANKHQIYVHGDFDADGVTSTALLTRFFRVFESPVHYFVPHRLEDGHGMTPEAVQFAAKKGAKVLITCDVGIRAHESLALARSLGLRTIVTDHHEASETLPEADAVVNPKRDDSNYPFDGLCGAGVAFKLCQGLARSSLAQSYGINEQVFIQRFSSLAAIGTIADVMSLVDENRVIATLGLESIRTTKWVGLQQIRDASTANGDKQPYSLTSRSVAFGIGPRINAVGRLDSADKALELLLASKEQADDAAKWMSELEDFNTARKSLQEELTEKIIEEVAEWDPMPKVLVYGSPEMHPGIAGLVAGKLRERFNRPAFVCSFFEDGTAGCSGRSIPAFDMGTAIDDLAPLIHQGGGHRQAGGFRFATEKFEEIREFLIHYADERLKDEELIIVPVVDIELRPSDATVESVRELSRLEPTGNGNEMPRFGVRGAVLASVKFHPNGHAFLRFRLSDGREIKTNCWHRAEEWQDAEVEVAYDLIVEQLVNSYNGRESVEWKLTHYRPHQP